MRNCLSNFRALPHTEGLISHRPIHPLAISSALERSPPLLLRLEGGAQPLDLRPQLASARPPPRGEARGSRTISGTSATVKIGSLMAFHHSSFCAAVSVAEVEALEEEEACTTVARRL